MMDDSSTALRFLLTRLAPFVTPERSLARLANLVSAADTLRQWAEEGERLLGSLNETNAVRASVLGLQEPFHELQDRLSALIAVACGRSPEELELQHFVQK